MSSIDTNYYLNPGESVDSYNQRISAYNATKESGPITSTSLTPQSPITLPQPPAPTNYGGAVANGMATIAGNTTALTPPTAGPPDELTALFDKYLGSSTPPPSATDTYNSLYPSSGIDAAQSDLAGKQKATLAAKANLDSINARLAGINAEGQAMNLRQEGRQAPISAISGQEAENNRQTAIRALPLQAQALAAQAQVAAAQGNEQLSQNILAQAKDHLDTMLKLQTEDATNAYNYKQSLLDKVYEFATAKEKERIDAQKQDNANQHDITLENLRFQHQAQLAGLAPITGIPGAGTPTADAKQLETANSIGNILSSPDFNSTFGFINGIQRNIPGTAAYGLSQQINNLTSQLALAARGQLKGQGAVSDFEGKLLKDAQTALTLNMSPDQARHELIQVQGAIRTSSGLPASVKITAPDGTVKYGPANQQTITDAIAQGYRVEYTQ